MARRKVNTYTSRYRINGSGRRYSYPKPGMTIPNLPVLAYRLKHAPQHAHGFYENYAKYRAEGFSAKDALILVRGEEKPNRIDWKEGRRSYAEATVKRDGFTFKLTAKYDEDYDGFLYGTFGNEWKSGAERVPESVKDRHICKWFYPENPLKDLRCPRYGKHASWVLARQLVREEMRMAAGGDDVLSLWLHATAYRRGIKLGEASIGGIDFDGDESFEEVCRELSDPAMDLISDAETVAEAALARLMAEDDEE